MHPIQSTNHAQSMSYRIFTLIILLVFVGGILAACASAPEAPKTLDKIVWVSPRGTLEVMDDYNLWVAKEMGYCEDLGIDLQLQPGPQDSIAVVRLVAEGQADVGFPSPGVLVTGNDSGIATILVWEMMQKQVFDFAIAKGSPIKSVKDLEGKTISLWAPGGEVVVDPILVEAGLDPKSVNYAYGGNQWGQLVAQGQADAALAWRGLAAQWDAQGLNLDYLVGKDFSNHPANGYAIRRSDLDDPAKVEVWNRVFKCMAMGLDFGRQNPLAAAQITYDQFPALKEQMTPQLAFDSMWQLGCNYWQGYEEGNGYGYSDLNGWNAYIDTLFELGQIKTRPKTEDIVTNQFIAEANEFDQAKVTRDAENFELTEEWQQVIVPDECR